MILGLLKMNIQEWQLFTYTIQENTVFFTLFVSEFSSFLYIKKTINKLYLKCFLKL